MAGKLDELQEQIEALMKQKNELLQKERDSALNDINAKIKMFGFKPRDLYFSSGNAVTKRSVVPMKYRKGMDSWSGRGRKPNWVTSHLANGGKIEDLLIK
jgi:DNA-binding protein H-NS